MRLISVLIHSFRNLIKVWCWSISVGSSGLVVRRYT